MSSTARAGPPNESGDAEAENNQQQPPSGSTSEEEEEEEPASSSLVDNNGAPTAAPGGGGGAAAGGDDDDDDDDEQEPAQPQQAPAAVRLDSLQRYTGEDDDDKLFTSSSEEEEEDGAVVEGGGGDDDDDHDDDNEEEEEGEVNETSAGAAVAVAVDKDAAAAATMDVDEDRGDEATSNNSKDDDDDDDDDNEEAAVDRKQPAVEADNKEEDIGESESKQLAQVDETTAATGTAQTIDATKELEESLEEGEEEEEGGEDDDASATNNNKPSYSTRGRTTQSQQQDPSAAASAAASNSGGSALDRLAAVGDLLSLTASGKEHLPPGATAEPSAIRMRESFLSDSLTEEERRTRTRYLPVVEGMHALRKTEIKNDLVLARLDVKSKSSSGGTQNSKRSKKGDDPSDSGSQTEDGTMYDAETGEPLEPGEDRHVKRIGAGPVDFVVPSPAFVAPPPPESSSSSSASAKQRPSPAHVEAVTAFNPPRPPESIGAKKKHRMLRWERRPADINVDLTNYRKTVQRTREEWMNAVHERDRIVVTDNIVRRHLLQHLRCLQEETAKVTAEYTAIVHECLERTDLPSSRTRTRGAFKQSNTVVRDVLYALRALGKDMEIQGLVPSSSSSFETEKDSAVCNSNMPSGTGGVSAVSFSDWDRATEIIPPVPAVMASFWIVPGDSVETLQGEGSVVAVYGPGEQPLPPPTTPSAKDDGDAMDVEHSGGGGSPPKDESGTKIPASKPTTTKEAPATSNTAESLFSKMAAPRVAVRLPSGVELFQLDEVKSKENRSTYTDERMAQRWKGLVETATAVGGTVDIAAMSAADRIISDSVKDPGIGEPLPMDLDDAAEREAEKTDQQTVDRKRLLPFGAGLLPTAAGRGTNIHKASLAELDQEIEKAFYKGVGVLGKRDNAGVPTAVREREDERDKNLVLQARALQLRNQLLRQRRTRILNERTYAATQERASRVESLVSEMRTDLKSLKGRLDQEIRDLGISEEQAENILTAFYLSLDSQHQGEASPPKRARRPSRLDEGEGFETNEDDEEGVPLNFQAGAQVQGTV